MKITEYQDVTFPADGDYDYDNYLVGIMDARTISQYNFIFKNGTISDTNSDR